MLGACILIVLRSCDTTGRIITEGPRGKIAKDRELRQIEEFKNAWGKFFNAKYVSEIEKKRKKQKKEIERVESGIAIDTASQCFLLVHFEPESL